MYNRIPAFSKKFTVVTAAAAFHDNDQVGVAVEITGIGKQAFLKSITVLDKAKQGSEMDLLFFSEAPTNAVLSNAAADISDSEMASKFLGVVKVGNAAVGYVDPFDVMAVSSIYSNSSLNLLLKPSLEGSDSVWVLAVSRGTPTYSSTSDLVITLGLEKC